MIIISPSILSADFLNLAEDLKRFDGVDNLWLHLDIMDGHFVSNLTFGATVLKGIPTITNHYLDAHLMVTNPHDFIEPLSKIGVSNFTFHWEAITNHLELIKQAKQKFKSVGISLNPGTPITVIPKDILLEIDLVLVMSVHPGFGGQSFIENSIQKIEELNQIKIDMGLNLQIQVDGGVSDKNAQRLIDAGATNIVAGSFIFKEKNKDYKSQINKLR